jgi:hypothetical protein
LYKKLSSPTALNALTGEFTSRITFSASAKADYFLYNMYNFVILRFFYSKLLLFHYQPLSNGYCIDKLFICFNSLTNKLYFFDMEYKVSPFAPHTGIDSDCQKQRFLCLAFQMEYSLSHNNGIITSQIITLNIWYELLDICLWRNPLFWDHLPIPYNLLWQIEQTSIPTSTCQKTAWSLNDSAGS